MSRWRAGLFGWLLWCLAGGVSAASEWPSEGWEVRTSPQAYASLLASLKAAVEAEGMFVVTEAGPTAAAARRGVSIPGNRVVGVFRNDFAVRLLRLSVPAMIEAPMRFYVTENQGSPGSTLSWKTPSHVLSPYREEGGAALEAIAAELDAVFAAIARRAMTSSADAE